MLATEPAEIKEEKRTTLPPLETWNDNPRMRHIPSSEWMIRKLEGDLRTRIAKLTAPFAALASADPHYAAIETELRALCTAIDKLTFVSGGRRANDGGAPLTSRIETAIANAVAGLRALEATPFGRRAPYHHFERSKSESVYGALLSVIAHAERVIPLIRSIDADIDEKLLG